MSTKAKQRKAKEGGFNLAPASQTGIPEYDAFGDMNLKRHFGRRGVVQQLLDTGLVERDEDDRDAIVVCDTPKAIFWSKPEHLQGQEEDVEDRMERSRSARLAAKEALPKASKAGSRSPGSPGSEGMSKASKAARHKQHIAHAEEAARLTSFPPWADNAKSLDFTEDDSLTEADAAAARGRRMLAAREAEDAAVEDSRLTYPRARRNSPGSPGSPGSSSGSGNGHGQGGEGHSGHHLDHADAAAESFFKSNKDILEFDDNARQREELRKMKEEQAKDAAGRCAVCSGYCAFPSKRWNIS